ncbi:multi protein bridging factor 1-domain-containing protein [Myxozyma melibiosi]|uniref:Multi protein bridging factor 1-domain-containing protein n=1 Tax=Myxozyma melibiosi TaxID=54550 RepID=A0ABR1F393_9ASCO
MGDQDWDSVTYIGQKATARSASAARSNAQINAARRTGAVVSTDKKYGAGSNRTSGTEGQRLAKIDRENEVAPPPKIDLGVGKAISKARLEKSLTQKDLAVKVNEKANIINDYEMGRAVPNQQLLGKLERVLGVKLRGKDIGSPLGGPKKK